MDILNKFIAKSLNRNYLLLQVYDIIWKIFNLFYVYYMMLSGGIAKNLSQLACEYRQSGFRDKPINHEPRRHNPYFTSSIYAPTS